MCRLREFLKNKKAQKNSEALRKKWLKKTEKEFDLSARDARLLDRASSRLVKNVVTGNEKTWGTLRGIVPSPGKYKGVWNWDCAFHALAVSRFDPKLSYEQCEIFINAQLPDGMFPDVIRSSGSVMDNYSKPPVFPWAFVEAYKRSPDREKLRVAYDAYRKNESFWREKRFDDAHGLFYYDATKIDDEWQKHQKWETGMDNSPRWDKGVSSLLAVDLNSFMSMFYEALGFMANALDLPDEAARWAAKGAELKRKINGFLWCEERGTYLDRDRFSNDFSSVFSSAHFVPLYAGCASDGQAAKIAENAADKKTFFPSMPTVAFSDPAFRSDDYWRGPVWLNYAYWAVEGLEKYGYHELAGKIRETVLDYVDGEKKTIFEYYDAKTGKGLGARDFGWSAAFTVELICARYERDKRRTK